MYLNANRNVLAETGVEDIGERRSNRWRRKEAICVCPLSAPHSSFFSAIIEKDRVDTDRFISAEGPEFEGFPISAFVVAYAQT